MPHTLKDRIGFTAQAPATSTASEENRLREVVNLKLTARGYPVVGKEEEFPFLDLGQSLIARSREKSRLKPENLHQVLEAGERRVVVVSHLLQAVQKESETRRIRRSLG